MTASPMANDLVVQRAGLPTDRPADLGEGGVKEMQHEGSGRARKCSLKALRRPWTRGLCRTKRLQGPRWQRLC